MRHHQIRRGMECVVLTCRCGGQIIEDGGEAVCGKCGVVHERLPEDGPAWEDVVRPSFFGGKWRL